MKARRIPSLLRQAGFLRLSMLLPRWGSQRFSPRDLFRSGEPGAHFEAYDPSPLLRRRNWFAQTEDAVASGGGSSFNLAVAGAAIAAPDGSITARKAVGTGAATQHWINRTALPNIRAGSTYTISIYAKVAEFGRFSTFGSGGIAGAGACAFNLSTTPQTTGAGGTITDVGGGWFRCTYTFTATADATAQSWYPFQMQDATGAATYTGDGASGMYFWGWQFDVGNTATAYQKVTDWNSEYIAAALESIGMWQDATGTLAVTAVEQPVGLWMDTKRGLARGPELIADGDNEAAVVGGITTGQRGLVARTAERAHGGGFSAKYTCNDATSGDHYVTLKTIPAGTGISVTVWVYNPTGGFPHITLVDASDGSWLTPQMLTKDLWVKITAHRAPKATSWPLAVGNGGGINGNGFVYFFDDVSVRELPGSPATQGTAGSKPVLSARYNLLTKTEQLLDASWTKAGAGTASAVTVTAGEVAPDGTATAFKVALALNGGTTLTDFAQLNGTGFALTTGVSYKHGFWIKAFAAGDVGKIVISRHAAGAGFTQIVLQAAWTFVSWAEVGNSVVTTTALVALRGTTGSADSATCVVWHPDLRTADDAAKDLPAYQRVNTPTDYDSEGYPHYLKFDGLDDSLQTPSIDFSGVDKMTVWAGVTKLSDSAAAIVAELTANASTTAGAFLISAPAGAASANYGAKTRGTVDPGTATTAATLPSANTSLLTLRGDIAADACSLAVNGVQAASLATDQGAGAFANAAMNIGRRGGATLPLNGRVYSLTVRGSTTPASENFIARMNRYAARLMKTAIA